MRALARPLLSMIFVVQGANSIRNPEPLVPKAQPVTDRLVLDQLSWFTPARWGYAASASTVDITHLVPGPLTPKDAHWEHTASAWWFDMGMLALLSVGYLTFVRFKIRLKAG